MNQRAKGKRHEALVAKFLEAQGWLVERSFYRSTFIPSKGQFKGRIMFVGKDLFGAFDLVGIKPPDQVRFIQVTAGESSNASARKEKTFGVWGRAEVWLHIRGPLYRVYEANGITHEITISIPEKRTAQIPGA